MKQAVVFAGMVLFWMQVAAQQERYAFSEEVAVELASLPLHCAETEYPNKLNQVLTDSTYLGSPRELHPVFYGCFDWHSAVHGYWLLATVLNRFPESQQADTIVALFDRSFTPGKVQAELAYFEPKLEKSFERTYGWAWLLKLHAELAASPLDEQHGWSSNLDTLTCFIVQSYKTFLPKLLYPIRVGEHTNTAFGLSLALDYARATGDYEFEKLIKLRAKDYFISDEDCPLSWEPGGFDFISPCLQEAELMSKVLGEKEFNAWIRRFLPQVFAKKFMLEPGRVADRTDGKLVHLDGLNFSRAWCFYALAKALPGQSAKLVAIGDAHLDASMPHVVGSDYMGSHWLATFLVYALQAREEAAK